MVRLLSVFGAGHSAAGLRTLVAAQACTASRSTSLLRCVRRAHVPHAWHLYVRLRADDMLPLPLPACSLQPNTHYFLFVSPWDR